MENTSQIILNKRTYPLYVGGSAASDFQDWDGKGSSVVLEVQVISEIFHVSDVVWQIEDEEIVGFDSNDSDSLVKGQMRVRARRTGITTVSAFLPDGACADCIITVIDNFTRLTVSEIMLNTRELHLYPGKSAELIPILYPKDIWQNEMLDTSLVWESMDEKVAYVEAGRVVAVGVGETDILVRSVDVGRVATCHVKISEAFVNADEEKITSDKTWEMCVGETIELGANGKELVWQSDNKYIVDVDQDGRVTACSASLQQKVDESGMVVSEVPMTVWIYATDVEGGMVTKYPIRVSPTKIPFQCITVAPARLTIPMGDSRRVTAASSHSAMRACPVRWESSAEEIVQVASIEDTIYGVAQAVLTAKGPGEAVVTAYCGDKKDCCRICITENAVMVKDVHMEREIEIDVDQVITLFPTLTEHANNKKLHWIGTDSTVVTLDRDGNVQGYHPGECSIYAIADDSLSEEHRACIQKLRGERKIFSDNKELQMVLETAVYGECRLQVKEGSKCLRNLHVVEESITDHSVLLLWNRATLLDTGDFEQYIVSRDGVAIATTKKLGYRAENLQHETKYQFQVKAVDKCGNTLAEAIVDVVTGRKSPIINVLDYGAAGDGSRLDTFFIQRAIDECPEGGTVLLPEKHVFVTGALFLKSNMTFRIDGILLGSIDPKDYPRVITRWEGWRKLEQPADSWANTTEKVPVNRCPHASLLNAGCYHEGENSGCGPYNVENLVICGKGQINANGFTLAYNEGPNINSMKIVSREYPAKDATSRGSAIRIHNGQNIYVKDIQIAYAPGWTNHTIYCDHITFDGLEVVSQGDGDCGPGADVLHCGHIFNGDGIDPESCTHMNLFDILFTTGDDAVAMKSGRNREGNELDKPNAYIRVTDCVSRWSLGGFGTGSEVASGSHDILFQNLQVEDILIAGIWIKTCPERGGVTEYIQVRDMNVADSDCPVWIFNTYSSTSVLANPALHYPIVRHLTFENVHGEESNKRGFILDGSQECPIQDVQFRVVSNGGKENRLRGCEDVYFI